MNRKYNKKHNKILKKKRKLRLNQKVKMFMNLFKALWIDNPQIEMESIRSPTIYKKLRKIKEKIGILLILILQLVNKFKFYRCQWKTLITKTDYNTSKRKCLIEWPIDIRKKGNLSKSRKKNMINKHFKMKEFYQEKIKKNLKIVKVPKYYNLVIELLKLNLCPKNFRRVKKE